MSVDPHELLSAYLDDQATADERRRAEELLATPEGQAAFDELWQIKQNLAQLPPVVPPSGVFTAFAAEHAGTSSHARWIASGAAVIAGAAVFGFASVASVGTADVDVAQLVELHTESVQLAGGGPAAAASDSPLPARLDDYDLRMAQRHKQMTAALYQGGDHAMTVVRVDGRPDWGSLSSGGASIDVDGEPGWMGEVAGHQVVIMQSNDVTYAVVAESADEVMMDAASQLPPGQRAGIGDRAVELCRKGLRHLGVG